MPVHPLADQAATLRATALKYVRSPLSREFWSWLVQEGRSFIMPAAWAAWPPARQIESVLAAESKRISEGTTFAMSDDLVRAARDVGADQSIPLPFAADVVPAPAGMLAFSADEPLMYINSNPVIAVTWGPPLEGFSEGVHLTWWTAMPEQGQEPDAVALGRVIPMVPDFEVHLPFLPHFDVRLYQDKQELPSGLLYSAIALRTVVAAWYALTADSTALSEQRPQAAVTQALKELKAKKRGVQIATSGGDAHSSITERAAHKWREVREQYDLFDPGPELAATPKTVSHGVFEAALDHQLDTGHRRIAHLYREAADHWHRLEAQSLQKYPGVFAGLEELRARESERWKPWCWVPSHRVAAWLMEVYDTPADEALWDGARIAALGAWRNGGRHSVLTPLPDQATAFDRVPVDLPETMPVPGLGMVVDDNGTLHLLLACLDDADGEGPADAELLLISNYGEPARMLENVTKLTLFLTQGTYLDALKATQAYYDAAAVQNGRKPPAPDEAAYIEHAATMAAFTGLLSGICAPSAPLHDAGALTGRKLPAPWPPEPNVLSEMTLWLPTGTPTP